MKTKIDRKEIIRVNSIPTPSATSMLRILQNLEVKGKPHGSDQRETSSDATRWCNNMIIVRDCHLVMS